jgi:hypothetical protein
VIERGLLNDAGAISGRAQAAVRPLSAADFARIVNAGLPESDIVMPRVDDDAEATMLQELRAPYHVERPIIERLIAKPERKAFFRRAVLQAYEERCAVTGWKLINGGGRASSCLRLKRRRGLSGPLGFRAIRRDARSRLRAAGRDRGGGGAHQACRAWRARQHPERHRPVGHRALDVSQESFGAG